MKLNNICTWLKCARAWFSIQFELYDSIKTGIEVTKTNISPAYYEIPQKAC